MTTDRELRRALRAWFDDQEAFGIEDVPAGALEAARRAEAAGAVESPGVPAEVGSPRIAESLERIAEEVAGCTACGLGACRTRTVPGQGSSRPSIVFVGEAPGAEEDRQGLAFVGRAGQLLTRMISAMGYSRDEVFIANILKCRPPGNRDPRPEEVVACTPYLRRQLALLEPEVLVALGGYAARYLAGVGPEVAVGRLRGRVHRYEGVPLVVTYHPSYLLRSPEMKRSAWEDLQLALRVIGREPPPRSRGRPA
jgi:DNA polymerase